jgi:excisionase family DNA binding protein
MTPEARIDRAKRTIADAIDELVEARIAKGAARAELVDQNASPLGRRRHLELVRAGKLPAVRDGRRVLVRRADIDTYLEEHVVSPPPVTEGEVDGMVERILGERR